MIRVIDQNEKLYKWSIVCMILSLILHRQLQDLVLSSLKFQRRVSFGDFSTCILIVSGMQCVIGFILVCDIAESWRIFCLILKFCTKTGTKAISNKCVEFEIELIVGLIKTTGKDLSLLVFPRVELNNDSW